MLLAGLFVRSPKFKFNSSNNLKKQAAALSVSEQSAWLIFQNTSSNRWLGMRANMWVYLRDAIDENRFHD